ncbi:MAG: hypothetical protein GXO42_01395 [bacterium]|nr:hypothetical protein [bacterium]
MGILDFLKNIFSKKEEEQEERPRINFSRQELLRKPGFERQEPVSPDEIPVEAERKFYLKLAILLVAAAVAGFIAVLAVKSVFSAAPKFSVQAKLAKLYCSSTACKLLANIYIYPARETKAKIVGLAVLGAKNFTYQLSGATATLSVTLPVTTKNSSMHIKVIYIVEYPVLFFKKHSKLSAEVNLSIAVPGPVAEAVKPEGKKVLLTVCLPNISNINYVLYNLSLIYSCNTTRARVLGPAYLVLQAGSCKQLTLRVTGNSSASCYAFLVFFGKRYSLALLKHLPGKHRKPIYYKLEFFDHKLIIYCSEPVNLYCSSLNIILSGRQPPAGTFVPVAAGGGGQPPLQYYCELEINFSKLIGFLESQHLYAPLLEVSSQYFKLTVPLNFYYARMLVVPKLGLTAVNVSVTVSFYCFGKKYKGLKLQELVLKFFADGKLVYSHSYTLDKLVPCNSKQALKFTVPLNAMNIPAHIRALNLSLNASLRAAVILNNGTLQETELAASSAVQ